MKRINAFLFCFAVFVSAKAQHNFNEAIDLGEKAFKNGEYKKAINKYFAAEAFDPTKKELVKEKVNLVFDRIEKLRVDAEKARKEAQEAKDRADKSAAQTKLALDKAQKLVGTFYFYNDRFALAYKSFGVNRAGIKMFVFYYIDKNGDEVEQLRRWVEAGPFQESGFAKVKRDEGEDKLSDYIIDTSGSEYRSAYDTTAIDSSIVALDLSGRAWLGLPSEVFKYRQLRVLILNGSTFVKKYIFNLNDSIGQLKNLEILQLSYCNIDTLPASISDLKKLTAIDFSNNNLSVLPVQLSELENLVTLDIGSNQLTKFPAQVTKLKKLQALDLRFNQLTNLPEETGEMKNLKSLLLAGNKIPKADIDKVKKLLPDCYIDR